jgi:Uma2 family endonuclease
MVLEVVSDYSFTKDTVELPPLYQRAGIAEFWRIDVRAELHFEILRLTAGGWVATLLPDGWWRSDVFSHDFRLDQAADPLGQPEYTLGARPSAS